MHGLTAVKLAPLLNIAPWILFRFDDDRITGFPIRRNLENGRSTQTVMGEKDIFAKRHSATGDIRIERENFRFYFPLGSCLLVSLILSLVVWVIQLVRG